MGEKLLEILIIDYDLCMQHLAAKKAKEAFKTMAHANND